MSNLVISVLIPVMNEVESLNKTIEIILNDSPKQNFEFIIILSQTSEEISKKNAYRIKETLNQNLKVIVQKYPGLGGAYKHGIEEATGSYILMIASDLETDPHLVKNMLSTSKEFPNCIITTTRWKGREAGFQNYGLIKLSLNYIFQRWVALLYKSNLTDFTFGFRLYPSNSIKYLNFENNNFAFLLEVLLRPLKNKWNAHEIPHFWQPRIEGESNNRKTYFLAYFKTAIKIRIENE